jgi:hypothetical protein
MLVYPKVGAADVKPQDDASDGEEEGKRHIS